MFYVELDVFLHIMFYKKRKVRKALSIKTLRTLRKSLHPLW